MKLSYRGVNHEEAPSTLELTDREITDMFRGQKRQFPYLRHISEPLRMSDRRYRDVAYPTTQPSTETTLVEKSVPAASCQTLALHNKCETLDKMMRSHLRNISFM
ncbi:MAG TPA: hypothetical protein DCE56_34705 [Cyanobacteria bacterium UBA8553]|nr:hypothetical protein [Cyanobacteria bacterium UBA8553]HAJ64170.1 hypothetical protein [Cyanobacteria bacterium UBA8543]